MSDFYETNGDKWKLLRETFNREGIQGLDVHVTDDLERWKQVKIKVAVTGNSGAGKSSLINALLGVDQSDKNAAKEGVKETTIKTTLYSYPDNDRIVLYDLPGVGTMLERRQSYLEKMNFGQYDFVIVVSSQRFTENDEMIIKELKRLEKSFYLVRSKIKADVENQKYTQTRDEVLDSVRDDCLINLRQVGVTAKDIFLIDSHVHKDFELCNLQMRLVQDAPCAFKTSLILTFKNLSAEIIKEKVKVLKSRARWVAIKAILSAAPGAEYFMNVKVIENEISFYKKELGLDDESLSKSCREIEVDMETLRKTVSTAAFIDFSQKLLQCWSDESKEKMNFKSTLMMSLLNDIASAISDSISKYSVVNKSFCNILDSLETISIQISENILDKIRGASFL